MASLSKSNFIGGSGLEVASSGKYAGKTRLYIVHEKIDKGIPFTLGDKAGGEQVYGISLSSKEGGKPNVSNWPYNLIYTKKKNSKKSSEQETVSITKIFKDEDLGGGGSRAKQADNTGPTESGCAYYSSLAFNVVKGELTKKDCTPAKLKQASKYVYATSTLAEFLKDGPEDWVEEDVYLNTANKIYSMYKDKFSGTVYCHRGSKFMSNLYKAKAAAQADDKKNDSLAPGSFSNDKWNPGDIWLSTLSPETEPLKECKTFAELKQCILNYAGQNGRDKKATLLAVSLKKPGNPNKALLQEFNTKDRSNYKDGEVAYDGFSYGKTGNFFSSNDVYLYMGGQDVQFRAFGTTTGWQGNIIGTGALGGKIGGGNVHYYLKNAKIKNWTGTFGTTNDFKETTFNKIKTSDYKFMYEAYVKYINKQSKVAKFKVSKEYSFAQFKKDLGEKGGVFIWQKYMGLRLIDAMQSASKKAASLVATEMLRYAASNTDISTYFIKIK